MAKGAMTSGVDGMLERWRSGGVEEWKSGGVEEWNGGGVEEWNGGGVEEWNGGGVEEWRSGTVEEWRSGRVEEWRSGRVDSLRGGGVEEWKSGGVGKGSRRVCCARAVIPKLLFALLPLAAAISAGPERGSVVGGEGTISHADLTTTIRQNTDRMAIDWQRYNVNVDERVHYIQPSSDSISLNRILSHDGSSIQGQIDANGHVILVNPNGVFFGEHARVNVGGMIASGLSIDPADFMNGDYLFEAMEGGDGRVVNAGVINASLGGSVSLIGQQVKNEGLISAQLGAVNLAAGNEAVVTFDQAGLVGVHITKAILQDELGVDPAVLNTGEITAESGRILLTGSVSQDLFSRAVNTGALGQARSVVMHEDGSFTLGAGADVFNSGPVDVSGEQAGQVVMLGENITSSGLINADSQAVNQAGGNIEIQSMDTTLLVEGAGVSALASNGVGGDIKLLGRNVGLADSANIHADGANGGGDVLIGGDLTGKNALVRNADFIYLGEDTLVSVDALGQGDGGRLITFAENTARIYGGLSARGGEHRGDGGFIETSGLRGFELLDAPDISAPAGRAGSWLIDPYNIIINNTASDRIDAAPDFTASGEDAQLDVREIVAALNGGATVTIQTTAPDVEDGTPEAGNITFSAELNYNGATNYNGSNPNTLILNAHGNIDTNEYDVFSNDNQNDRLNIEFNAGFADGFDGDVIIDESEIDTNGGSFFASGTNFFTNRNGNNDYISTDGGDVTLDFTGAVDIQLEVETSGGAVVIDAGIVNNNYDDGLIDTSSDDGAGGITITAAGNVVLGRLDVSDSDSDNGFQVGGNVSVTSEQNITLAQAFNFDDTGGNASSELVFRADNNITIDEDIFDSDAGAVDTLNVSFTADADTNGGGLVAINADIYTAGGNFTASGASFNSSGGVINTDLASSSDDGTRSSSTAGGDISITASDALTETIVLGELISEMDSTCGAGSAACGNVILNSEGAITQGPGNLFINGTTTINSAGDVTLNTGGNEFTGTVSISQGNTVSLRNEQTLNLGQSTVSSTLNATVDNNGSDITQSGVITVDGDANFSAGGGAITLDNARNNFSAVAIDAAVSANVADEDDIALGDITLSGSNATTLTVAANNGGNITQTSGTTIINNGTADGNAVSSFITSGNITLNNIGNDMVEAILGGAQVGIRTTTDLILGTPTVTDTLTVIVDGASNLTQSGAITVTNAATFQTTGADITLDNNGNDFGSVAITNASNATLVDANGIELAASNVTNNLTVTALGNGDITQSADLSVGDEARFTAQGNQVLLNEDGYANSFNSVTVGSARNVALRDADSLVLNASIITNDLTVRTDAGAVSQNGALRVANVATFNTDNSAITLQAPTNEFNRVNVERAASVSIVDQDNIQLGDILVSGDSVANRVDIQAESITQVAATQIRSNNGGGVSLTANGIVTVVDIDTRGVAGDADGGAGGAVSLTGATIAAGVIDASGGDATTLGVSVLNGGDAGQITLNAVNNSGTKTVTLANNIRALGGAGVNGGLSGEAPTVQVNLQNEGSGTGSVSINYSDSFLSALQINGSDDNDTLNAPTLAASAANTWTFNGATGSLNATITFNNIESLVGGTNNDNFDFTNDTAFNGTVSGGAGGANSLTSRSADSTLQIAGANNGSVARSGGAVYINDFQNIQQLTGAGSSDTLQGRDTNTAWQLDDTNAVEGFTFTGMETLAGGSGVDTFTIDAASSGVINGNEGDDLFTVNQAFTGELNGDADNDTFIITADGVVSGAGINGGADNNTLQARNAENTWAISNANQGSVALTASPTSPYASFQNIQTLTGSVDNGDTFNFTSSAATVTTINADGVSGTPSGTDTISYAGVAGILPAINLGGSFFTGIERVEGNQNGIDSAEANATTVVLDSTGGSDIPWSIGDFDAAATDADGINDGTVADGTVAGIQFINVNNLSGGEGNDTFTFSSAAGENARLTGAIDGGARVDAGAENDIIQGRNTATTWNVTSDGGGSVVYFGGDVSATLAADTTTTFSNVETLRGGSLVDNFDLSALVALPAMTVDGGSGGASDTMSLPDTDLDITVGASAAGSLGLLNIGDITAQADRDNILRAPDASGGIANEWLINNANEGQVTIDAVVSQFFNFQTLIGADARSDNFTIESLGSIGTIRGADLADADGASDSMTVERAASSNVAWTINGDNVGAVTGIVSTFSGLDALTGDVQNDNVTIQSGGSFAGAIEGGSGNNVIGNDNANGAWQLDTGQEFAGTFNTNASFSGFDRLAGSGSDVLVGRNQDNDWQITASGRGTVAEQVAEGDTATDSINFTGMSALTGNNSADNFTIATTDAVNITVDGAGNSNTLVGGNRDNNWIIGASGADSNTLNYLASTNQGVAFSNIDDFFGNTNTDIFIITNGTATVNSIYGLAPTLVATDNGRDELTVASNNGDNVIWRSTADFDGSVDSLLTRYAGIEQVNGGNGNDSLIGPSIAPGGMNDWLIGTTNTLNGATDFDGFERYIGNVGDDRFVIEQGASVTEIRGIAQGFNDTGRDTLVVASASDDSTTWRINGEGVGSVTGRAAGFSGIENVTGGEGADTFIFDAAGRMVGLVDGGEIAGGIYDEDANPNPASDSENDGLNVTAFTSGVVVELGSSVFEGTLVADTELLPNINAFNIEVITALDRVDNNAENANWLAINLQRDISFAFVNQNRGTLTEVFDFRNPASAIPNTAVAFNNFGSIQGGSGNVASEPSSGGGGANLSGEYRQGAGLVTRTYAGRDGLVVVDIDDRLVELTGNGNTLLRVPEGSVFNLTDNRWTIDGVNSGSFFAPVAGEADFQLTIVGGVNQLQGGQGDDSFIFSGNGNLIDGSINGGLGVNALSIQNANQALTLGMNTVSTTESIEFAATYPQAGLSTPVFLMNNRANMVDVANVSTLAGDTASVLNLYSGASGEYVWQLGGTAGNTVTGNGDSLTFTNVNQVFGGAADDAFTINALGVTNDIYDGGAGTDRVSFGVATAVDAYINPDVTAPVTVPANSVYLTNIENVTGNGGESQLIAGDAANEWQMTAGENLGRLNNTVDFSGFTILVGGALADTFTVNGGEFNGTLRGGAGDDILNYTVAADITRNLIFDGGDDPDASTDTLILSGDLSAATPTYRGNYAPELVGRERLHYTNDTNTDSVSFAGVENVQDNVTVAHFTVSAPMASTEFGLGENNFSVNDATLINYDNKQNLTVAGRIGDQITVNGNVNIAGELTLAGAAVLAGGAIAANSLVLDSTGQVGSADVGERLNTDITHLTVSNVNADVFLEEANALNFRGVQTNGILDIVAAGDISDSGALTSSRRLSLNSSVGGIELDEQNRLQGEIALAANGDIALTNETLTSLGDVSGQTLSVTAGGAIVEASDSSRIAVVNSSTFTSGDRITLDNDNHDLGTVTIVNASNVRLNDVNALRLANVNAAGIVTVTSEGATVDGPITAASLALNGGGAAVSINNAIATTDAVTINGEGIITGGAITGSGVVLDASDGALVINAGVTATAGDLMLSGNGVLQEAALSAGATTRITSAAGVIQNANIDSATNIEVVANNGSLTMLAGTQSSAGNNLRYTNAGGNMSLTNLRAGTIDIVSDGVMTQGADLLAQTGSIAIQAGAVTMNPNTELSATAGGVSVVAADSLLLTGMNARDDISLIAQAGAVTQTAAITSLDGDIGVNSGAQITMQAGSVTTANAGGIAYAGGGDIAVTTLAAPGGVASLTSTGGRIVDANDADDNLIASRVELSAATGIGADNVFELRTGALFAENQRGVVQLANTGVIDIERLHNVGDISFSNDVDLRIASTGIDAGFDDGALFVETAQGSILGLGQVDFAVADVTAREARFVSLFGDFGSPGRPIVINVRDTVEVFTTTAWSPVFISPTDPANIVIDGLEINLFDLSGVAGEQLVEVEALEDVDPAIFTEVRNFLYDDVSIRLPRDQLFEDELDDDDDGQI